MIYAFGDYRLDTERFELRCKGELRPIEPQVFDVLTMLIEHRDRVVTKEEILDTVWADRYVTEAALSSRLASARKAVGDDGRSQEVIRTIHGRGFRFVAPVTPLGEAPRGVRHGRLVGRARELERLGAVWDRVRSGTRRTVFVTGEPGIGKTTLVEAFLAGLDDEVRVAGGHCADRPEAAEAYLPVLEALGRLARGPDGRTVLEILGRHAPSWLLEMPELVGDDLRADLERRVPGASRQRMLREMAGALEVLASERPLVLVLEELHRADVSTVELLSWLAGRTEPCRLMVLATFRPTELESGDHPLRTAVRELRIHGLCEEVPVPLLDRAELAELLAARLPGLDPPEAVLDLLHGKSEGNPLFVECLVDTWIERGALERDGDAWTLRAEPRELDVGVPKTLAELIEGQLLALAPEDRVLLETASVAGTGFSAALVAAALERAEEEVEERFASLARRGRFVEERGVAEWPDGTVAGHFAFLHDLYREFLYARVPPGRRTSLHRRVARRLQEAWRKPSRGRRRRSLGPVAATLERT